MKRGEKEPFEFYTTSVYNVCALIACWNRSARRNNRAFVGVLLLITSRNRFARRKSPSNTSETRLLLPTRNGQEIDASMTTRQLFQPNDRRRAASLLPIRLPIPNVLILNCPRPLRSRARLPRLIKSNTDDDKSTQNQTKKHEEFRGEKIQ